MAPEQKNEDMTAWTNNPDRLVVKATTGGQPNGTSRESKLSPGLYVVATPIGNLRDMTLRGLDVLAGVDAVVCEDTRVTGKLLKAYGIKALQVIAYHEHNAAAMRPGLLRRLAAGEALALTSDAGTPLVSDPGYKLVREAADSGIEVFALPGASASLAALVSSGLPTDRFMFAGFLPPRRAARRKVLGELAALRATLIFFESTRRLAASLADMAAVLGPRAAAVARELTKLHEETRRDTLPALAAHYQSAGPPKGEAVVVVGPPAGEAAIADIDAMLSEALDGMSVRDAAAAISTASGRPRREVYARALEIAAARRESGGGK